MVTEHLKNATEKAHRALEGMLIPVIKNTYSEQAYAQLLAMFYGYYKPVEDLLDMQHPETVVADYEQRRKSALIIDDLQALQATGQPLTLCPFVPAIAGMEQALGAMYVLEGSTLGGLVISRMLQRNLPATGAGAFGFFAGYRHDTPSRWLAFCQALDRYAPDAEQLRRMTGTADEVFTQLKTWACHAYKYEPTEKKL